jgi:hypothetical protein
MNRLGCVVMGVVLSMASLGCDDGESAGVDANAVIGTLTLPASAPGKPYGVRLLAAPGGLTIKQTLGTTTGSQTIEYAIANVPPGRYFLLGFVDVDSSGGDSSTPGDFAGWCGHNGDGNPPSAANVEVPPPSGIAGCDFSLVVR